MLGRIKKHKTTITTFAVLLLLFAASYAMGNDDPEAIFGDTMSKGENLKEYLITKVAALLATFAWFGFFIAMLFGKAQKENFARITGACVGIAMIGAIVDYFIG